MTFTAQRPAGTSGGEPSGREPSRPAPSPGEPSSGEPSLSEPTGGSGAVRDRDTASLEVRSRAATGAEPDRALLTGLAICSFCGSPVRSQFLSAGRVAYLCDVGDVRRHLARSAAPVDAWIRLQVIERLGREDARDLLGDPSQPDLHELRAQSGDVRTRRSQLEHAAEDGTVDRSEAAARSVDLDAELAVVEEQMIDHVRRDLPISLTGADPGEVGWDRLGLARQRDVLLALTERIALHPVPPGRRPGDPDVLQSTVILTWRT